ncbi:MAG: hypothetical protein U0350_21935 [Caldilineaceae bacterium]
MQQKQTSAIFMKPALTITVSALLLTAMLCWLPSLPAQAAVMPVACDAAALIAAINTANASPEPDTLNLTAGCTYTFTQVDNWWYGPNALPAIASAITIEGNGAILKIPQVDATGAPIRRLRFFYVGADPLANGTFGFNTPGAGHLTLHNLTLTGGHQKGGDGGDNHGSGAGMGGAIFNQGYLTLTAVTLINNRAAGGNGGQDDGGGLGGMGGAGFGGPVVPAGSKGGKNSRTWSPECPYGAGGGGFGPTENGNCRYGGGPQDGLGGDGWGDHGGHGGHGSGGGGFSYIFPWGGSGGDFGFNNPIPITDSMSTNGGGGVGGGAIGVVGYHASGEGGGGFGGGGIHAGFGGGGGSNSGHGGFGGGDGSERYWMAYGPGGGGAGLGGAIFNHGGLLTITSSIFHFNLARGGDGYPSLYESAFSDSHGASGLGGAIFNLNGTVTLTNSSLISNTVITGALAGPKNEAAGGAVYNLGYNLLPGQVANLTIISSTLAQSLGGSDLVNDQPLNVPLAAGGGFNLAAAHLHLVGQNDIAFYHLNDTARIHGIGQYGWYSSAVTVTWTITDDQGTILKQSGCTPQVLTKETDGTMQLTCIVTHTTGIVSESELVKWDYTKPTISAFVFVWAYPNARGWYTAPVTIGFNCYDAEPGSLQGNCPADQVLTTEGMTVTSQSQTVTDLAGNRSAPSNVITVKIDKTLPTITATVMTTPNAHGWYTTTPVIVRFTCTDAVSGIPEGRCPDDQVFAAEGAVVTSSVQTVTDLAGNTSTPSNLVTLHIDQTPPTINVSVPTPNRNGWYHSAVPVHYHCVDAISGVPPGVCPPDERLEAESATILSQVVTDMAGNRSAPSQPITVKIDNTKPACRVQATPAFLTPADHQLVTITTTVTVTDALSGPAGFNLESVIGNLVDSGQSDIRGWKPGTPSTQGQLRAEPGVSNQPRSYTLTYRGFDQADNSVLCSVTVPVLAAEDVSVIFLPWISHP